MIKNYNLLLLRIAVAFFLTLAFKVFNDTDNEIGAFGMLWTTMVTISYITAEIVSAYTISEIEKEIDKAKQKP